ncbi:MAG: hypothetical protein M0D53_14250 [Flavobacterium sp. JAD_PAG50586_2]|nr:MAG: hypothetical protein M0D53_14250 [Flavobacterium sp. JAD_PAG50586_2]
MENFQLSLLCKIIGIGSASGLVYHDDKLFIISDSSNYLYEYNLSDEKLNKIALIDNPKENIVKKDKPDFESITLSKNHITIIGSGSTQNRNLLVRYDTDSKSYISKDIGGIFSLIKKQYPINDNEFNIEGLISKDGVNYLFQRGNGLSGKNGIFYYNETKEKPIVTFNPFDLPKIKNIPATFTDAVLVDGIIYFLATAEDTTSTYLDGEVLGSLIGSIDLKTMKLINTIQITDKHKFEGLTLYKETNSKIEFLLCEDNDTEKLESDIYKLVLEKAQ